MRKVKKSRGYVERPYNINVHVCGIDSEENREKLADGIKTLIHRFKNLHSIKELEYKITLD